MAKMNAYATFDDYLADQSRENRAIIRGLRAFVKKKAPQLVESVKWGNGCWLAGKVPVVYVYADRSWVQFGFLLGSRLDDPRGLLEGAGQYVRHVKVHEPEGYDSACFAKLLKQAIAVTTERMSDLSAGSGKKKSTTKTSNAPLKRAKKASTRKKL